MDFPKEKDTSLIPPGSYCSVFLEKATDATDKDNSYHWTLRCPYLEFKLDQEDIYCGYCHFLEAGDYEEDGTFLLTQAIKECGQNVEKGEESWYKEFGGDPENYYRFHIEWAEKVIPLLEEGEHKEVAKRWLDRLREKKDA